MVLHCLHGWRRDSRPCSGQGDSAPGLRCGGRDGVVHTYGLMSVHVHDVHAFALDVTRYLFPWFQGLRLLHCLV